MNTEIFSLDPHLVIVNPNARATCYGVVADDAAAEPPLWARLIAGYVRDRGFTVKIVDAEAENLTPSKVALDLFMGDTRLVCLCAYGHQPSASTQQMEAVYDTARQIKSVCAAKVLVVGGHVSALPNQTMRECEHVDYVCVGEGPETVCRLLSGSALEDVPGLVWRDGARIRINARAPLIEDLSKLHGDVWELLPMKKYRAHGWQCLDDQTGRKPYASIYTSLGCPYSCSFCCINAPFGVRRYRMRNPADVVKEIEFLYSQYGVRTFKIIDEMFVLNERHYSEICERIIETIPNAGTDLNIWAYARVDTVRAGTLPLLRKAGIKWLALGIESADPTVRDGAEKRLRTNDIKDIVGRIQAAGINVIANYIFGLPQDDAESMQLTLDMALAIGSDWANFYCATAYPGSPLYDEAVSTGQPLPDRWGNYAQHAEDFQPLPTDKLNPTDILQFRDAAHQAYFSSEKQIELLTYKFGPAAAAYAKAQSTPLPRRLFRQAAE